MTEYSPTSTFPPIPPQTQGNRFSRTLSLENTLRHQTNKPKHERIKRFPHRKSKTDSKKKYFIDDMRLNASTYSDNSYNLPSRAASHTETHSSPNNSFYSTRDHPIVYFTPHSPEDQLPISDDNLSNITQHQISETDFSTNSKFTDLLLKPKNVFKESDAYRHLTRMIRPRSGNMRGGLLTNSDSERGCGANSFVPSDTNSEDDMSHYRFMQNRNVHNIAYHSQDKEKLLDLIRSDLERVKGEFREVKTGHFQLGKSVEDVEGKLNDSQYRISNIEHMLTDFTEMHQNEVQELKQQLAQIQYDSVARVQDLEEGQDILQRKIIELEVRTNMQESASQLFAPNGGGFFRSLLFKVLNVVILIISIIAMTTVKLFSQFRYKGLRSIVIIIFIVYISYYMYYNGWEYIDWRLFIETFCLPNYIMASPNVPDYIAVLTANIIASKNEIRTKFKSIKENLDLQKRNIIDQIDGIFSENMITIKELQTLQTQTLESKETLAKTTQNPSLLQSLSQNFDSTLENLSSQIENLTSIKFSWNIPENLWENLIHIGGTEENLDKDITPEKIVKDVCKGENNGNLSGNLKDMRINGEKIYISDKGASAIKIFTRSGEYLNSYTNDRLTSPGSMTIHRDNLYVLTDQHTDRDYNLIEESDQSISLFKISTLNLDTLSILNIKFSYGVIDTNGKCLYLLLCYLTPEGYHSIRYHQRGKLESWNFSLKFREITLKLSSLDKYFPKHRGSNFQTRYQQNTNLVLFYDMKIQNNEIFILFSNSIYLLQSFDLNGNLLRAILEEDLTLNIVGITLKQQENGLIILRDESNSQILIFSYEGKLIRTIESEDTPHGLKFPMCMDIDEKGILVVCDRKHNWKLQDIPI